MYYPPHVLRGHLTVVRVDTGIYRRPVHSLRFLMRVGFSPPPFARRLFHRNVSLRTQSAFPRRSHAVAWRTNRIMDTCFRVAFVSCHRVSFVAPTCIQLCCGVVRDGISNTVVLLYDHINTVALLYCWVVLLGGSVREDRGPNIGRGGAGGLTNEAHRNGKKKNGTYCARGC